jgi:tetratricopeptide (TPR) repeat protein
VYLPRHLSVCLAWVGSCVGFCVLLSGCATSRPPDAFLNGLREHPRESALVGGVPPYSDSTPQAEYGSLASVGRFWKKAASPSSAERWYRAHSAGIDPAERPLRYAVDLNLWAFVSRGSSETLKARLKCGVPVIVALQSDVLDVSTRQFPMVIGYDDREQWFLCHEGKAQPSLVAYGDFDKAWRACDYWMLTLCPPEKPCWKLDGSELASRAAFYESTMKHEQAAHDAEAAVAAGVGDSTLQVTLGNSYRALGRTEKAEAAYRLAVSADSHNARAYNNLAYLLAENKQSLGEAVALARQALMLDPTSPLVNDTLGFALYQEANYTEAADVLERARARSRDLPVASQVEIGMHLVWAQVKSGQLHLARQVIQDLQRLDPQMKIPEDLRPLLGPPR